MTAVLIDINIFSFLVRQTRAKTSTTSTHSSNRSTETSSSSTCTSPEKTSRKRSSPSSSSSSGSEQNWISINNQDEALNATQRGYVVLHSSVSRIYKR